MSLECIAEAARCGLEFLQCAGAAAAQAVLQVGAAALWPAPGRMCPSTVSAETVNGSTAAVLSTSSSLFQLPCLPGGILVREAAALGLWLCLMYCRGS